MSKPFPWRRDIRSKDAVGGRRRLDVPSGPTLTPENGEHYEHENRRAMPDRRRRQPIRFAFPNEYFERLLSEPLVSEDAAITN